MCMNTSLEKRYPLRSFSEEVQKQECAAEMANGTGRKGRRKNSEAKWKTEKSKANLRNQVKFMNFG